MLRITMRETNKEKILILNPLAEPQTPLAEPQTPYSDDDLNSIFALANKCAAGNDLGTAYRHAASIIETLNTRLAINPSLNENHRRMLAFANHYAAEYYYHHLSIRLSLGQHIDGKFFAASKAKYHYQCAIDTIPEQDLSSRFNFYFQLANIHYSFEEYNEALTIISKAIDVFNKTSLELFSAGEFTRLHQEITNQLNKLDRHPSIPHSQALVNEQLLVMHAKINQYEEEQKRLEKNEYNRTWYVMNRRAEEERERLANEEEKKQLADKKEQKRLHRRAVDLKRQLAKEERERLATGEEKKQLADEKERKRLAEREYFRAWYRKKRLAAAEEKKHLAAEEEQKRLADEKKQKRKEKMRLANKKSYDKKRLEQLLVKEEQKYLQEERKRCADEEEMSGDRKRVSSENEKLPTDTCDDETTEDQKRLASEEENKLLADKKEQKRLAKREYFHAWRLKKRSTEKAEKSLAEEERKRLADEKEQIRKEKNRLAKKKYKHKKRLEQLRVKEEQERRADEEEEMNSAATGDRKRVPSEREELRLATQEEEDDETTIDADMTDAYKLAAAQVAATMQSDFDKEKEVAKTKQAAQTNVAAIEAAARHAIAVQFGLLRQRQTSAAMNVDASKQANAISRVTATPVTFFKTPTSPISGRTQFPMSPKHTRSHDELTSPSKRPANEDNNGETIRAMESVKPPFDM